MPWSKYCCASSERVVILREYFPRLPYSGTESDWAAALVTLRSKPSRAVPITMRITRFLPMRSAQLFAAAASACSGLEIPKPATRSTGDQVELAIAIEIDERWCGHCGQRNLQCGIGHELRFLPSPVVTEIGHTVLAAAQ